MLEAIRTYTQQWDDDSICELDKFLEVIKKLRPDIHSYQT